MTTLDEIHSHDAIQKLPEGMARLSGFLELIEINQREQIRATDAQTAAIKDLAEAVYTLVHLQAAKYAAKHKNRNHEMGLDLINQATRHWLVERDLAETLEQDKTV
jgi:hypothetical protein